MRLTGRAVADRHLTQYWDTGRNAWRTPSGRFTALVGPSSDTVLQQSFTLGRR